MRLRFQGLHCSARLSRFKAESLGLDLGTEFEELFVVPRSAALHQIPDEQYENAYERPSVHASESINTCQHKRAL